MQEIKIFKIKIHPLKRSEFLSIIKSNIEDGNQMTQVGVNSATVNELVKNEEFRRAVNNADLIHIDGMSVVWALRHLGYTVPERVATPDLADDVIKMAEKEKYSIFLLGAKEAVLASCRINLEKNFPDLKIAGCQSGFYKPEEELSIVKIINKVQPDILFLGMSSPKKEFFFEQYRHDLKVKYVLGVGGYFDIISGHLKRAPRWMQDHGMEWLYRLIQEPRRMWRRYLIGINQFLWLVLKMKYKKTDVGK
jgi:N-acetylglucosaminyldiphosphoundecaprenol N-acetyl-beta-D-mannosaminyltransferase